MNSQKEIEYCPVCEYEIYRRDKTCMNCLLDETKKLLARSEALRKKIMPKNQYEMPLDKKS